MSRRSSARIKMMFGGFEAGSAYAPMPPDASAAVPRVALRSPAGSQVKVTFQLRVIGFNRHVIASRLSLPTAPPAPSRTPAGKARLLSGEKDAGADAREAIAAVLGVPAEDIRVRERLAAGQREWPALAAVVTRSGRISRARLRAISLRRVTRSGGISRAWL